LGSADAILIWQQGEPYVAAVDFSTPTVLLSSIQAQLSERQGFQRLSHYEDLSVLITHLTTQRDKENPETLQEKLPNWLLTECEWGKDGRDEQGLEPSCIHYASRAPMLTHR